jgi:hypothetical protein
MLDFRCEPRLQRNGKWTFTIFENNRWIEESASDFLTPEEAMRAAVARVERIKRTRQAVTIGEAILHRKK